MPAHHIEARIVNEPHRFLQILKTAVEIPGSQARLPALRVEPCLQLIARALQILRFHLIQFFDGALEVASC